MPVIFKKDYSPKYLDKELKVDKNFVIIKNKDIKYFKTKNFDIIKKGRKYTLVEEKGKWKKFTN